MAWFSFSRDSLVTKIFPTLLSRFVNTNLLVSLSYVCQLSKCDAGDTMRCTYVSIFTSASFKICNFDSSKICKDNFNTAFTFETDHIQAMLNPPRFVCQASTFQGEPLIKKYACCCFFSKIYFPWPLLDTQMFFNVQAFFLSNEGNNLS